jgi:hypothetical protein
MPDTPPHLAWLTNTHETIQTADGLVAEVWELIPESDQAVLSAWSKHFREHYCEDALLDKLREGTGLSRAEYLEQMKFPHATEAPGPSIRSGDFAEILIADYVEFKLGYWCPRELRYDMKWNRNESTKGCDVLGFRFVRDGRVSPSDELFIFEAKARLSGNAAVNRLQDAVDDSAKDPLREGMSLNALKQRCIERADNESAAKIRRFQNMADRPFKRLSGAAAVLSTQVYDRNLLAQTTTAHHPNSAALKLIVVKGNALMPLVHALYERAKDEA